MSYTPSQDQNAAAILEVCTYPLPIIRQFHRALFGEDFNYEEFLGSLAEAEEAQTPPLAYYQALLLEA
jgi:hypothetical protein